MSKFLTSTTVEVDVDVYTDDLSDETLLEILEERGLKSVLVDDDGLVIQMYEAFQLGKTERAMQLARQIACEYTGRIL